ncbi:SseB family protein [Actinoplanes sp. NPDC049681]|uniref:SseB family protein n=1 Tax=Actinoplanes sp. NPDC049681 TaxID=3363905 RepID=UPI003790E2AB
MTEWEPATDAEVAMRNALRTDDQESYFRILAGVDLLLPVSADALAGLAPMGWGTWSTGGRTHVLAFTSPSALQACLSDYTGSARRVPYSELAETWPNLEWWLAVNPGLPIEGYLPAWFVAQLSRGDLRLPKRGPARDGANATDRIKDLHAAAMAANAAAARNYASPASGGPMSGDPTGTATAAGAESGAYAAGAPGAGEHGAARSNAGGYGPGGPDAPENAPGAAAAGYGPGAAPAGYGPGSAAAGYGPGAAAAGFGPGSAAAGYGQGRAAAGYGPGEPAAGYDQGEAAGGREPGVSAGQGAVAASGAGTYGGPNPASSGQAADAPPTGPGGLPVRTPGAVLPSGLPSRVPATPPGLGGPGSSSSFSGFTPGSGQDRPGPDVPASSSPPSVPPASAASGGRGPGSGSAVPPGSALDALASRSGMAAPSSGASALDALGSRAGAPARPGNADTPAGGAAQEGGSLPPLQRPDGPLPTRTPMAQTPPLPSHLAQRETAGGAAVSPDKQATTAAGQGATAAGQSPAADDTAAAAGESPAGQGAAAAGQSPAGQGAAAAGESPAGQGAAAAGESPAGQGPAAAGQSPAGEGAAASGQGSAAQGAAAASQAQEAGQGATAVGQSATAGPEAKAANQGDTGQQAGDTAGPGGLPRRQVASPAERPPSMAAAAQALAAKGEAGASPTEGPAADTGSRPPSSPPRASIAPPVIPGAGGANRTSVPEPATRPTIPGVSSASGLPTRPTGGNRETPGSVAETQRFEAPPTVSRAPIERVPGDVGPAAGAMPHAGPAPQAAAPATGHAGRIAPPPYVADEDDFIPANEVERNLYHATLDHSTDAFLSTLLLATVLVPVADNSRPGSSPGESGFASRTEEMDGERFLVVFTSRDRLSDHYAEPARTVAVRFVELIRNWPDPAWSFAVNPGTAVGAKYPGPQVIALANWALEAGLGGDPVEEVSDAAAVPERSGEAEARPTTMQKTVAAEQVDYYLERGYDRVAGFVHRAAEVEHLRSPGELFAALGLLYDGSPYQADAKEAFVLRWPAFRPSLYRIPYGGQSEQALRAMDGWVIERPPFRGNGFAPGEGKDVIAEFKVDSVRLPHGAQLWHLDAEGQERLLAVFDCDAPVWRRVAE